MIPLLVDLTGVPRRLDSSGLRLHALVQDAQQEQHRQPCSADHMRRRGLQRRAAGYHDGCICDGQHHHAAQHQRNGPPVLPEHAYDPHPKRHITHSCGLHPRSRVSPRRQSVALSGHLRHHKAVKTEKEQEHPGQTGTDEHNFVQHDSHRLLLQGPCNVSLKHPSLGTDHRQNHIQVPQRMHSAPSGTGLGLALHAVGLGAHGLDDHLLPGVRLQHKRAVDGLSRGPAAASIRSVFGAAGQEHALCRPAHQIQERVHTQQQPKGTRPQSQLHVTRIDQERDTQPAPESPSHLPQQAKYWPEPPGLEPEGNQGGEQKTQHGRTREDHDSCNGKGAFHSSLGAGSKGYTAHMHPALQALLLLPVLLVQGLWVITQVERLPEAAGPREGSTGQGPLLRLLVLGDSSAAGVGVAHQDQALMGQLRDALAQDFEVHWRLIAKGGVTTPKAHALLKASGDTPCDVAVVCLGVNDTKNGVGAAEWRTNFTALLKDLRSRGAKEIWVCGLPPIGEFPLLPWPLRAALGARAKYFDEILREVVEAEPAAHHLPSEFEMDPAQMAADGFHPGASIYAEWGHGLAALIREAPRSA
ncbi:MAG: lysophospholipase L1-like esterase [Cognaticolwellia sp.]|jgi:lysophospholipase L1-like esterase